MTARVELLAIHNILMCPAQCPPPSAEDTYTIGLLKNLITHWHSLTRSGKEPGK